MTCQWCIHYRRRKGRSLCLSPSRIGLKGVARTERDTCELFSPRKICTTCEHRCPVEKKDELASQGSECPEWELRSLSTWGGNRRRKKI